MPTYMYLFVAPRHLLSGTRRSPEEARRSGERWRDWEESLRQAGHEPTGAQLEPGGRCLTGPEKTTEDGAFGADHLVGGYFVVKASSLEQAIELAKGCPLLDNGGTVEVRAIMGL